MYNFDRVTYKIYKDNTAQTEAFKAGEFDYLRTFSAREWARTYVGKKFDSGELIKTELELQERGRLPGLSDQHAAREVQGRARAPGARARLRFRVDEPPADVQRLHARAGAISTPATSRPRACRARTSSQLLEPLRAQAPARRSSPRRSRCRLRPPARTACATICARPGSCSPRPAGPTATARCATPRARRSRSSTSTAAAAERDHRRPTSRRSRKLGIQARVPQGGLRADPEAARRVRLRSVHRAHSRQRDTGQRAAWTASAPSRPTPRVRAI